MRFAPRPACLSRPRGLPVEDAPAHRAVVPPRNGNGYRDGGIGRVEMAGGSYLKSPLATGLGRDQPALGSVRWHIGEMANFSNEQPSSRARGSAGESVTPSAFAVLRFIINSNVVDCSTGRSAALRPSGSCRHTRQHVE